jgi:SAM-dependent methyltransferase
MRAAHSFKVSGLKSFGDILEPLCRHAKLSEFRRILDWGCGCGRVTMHFLALSGLGELMGCDIDGAAVRWTAEFLPHARFSVLAPMPPSSYPDAHFDLIYSYSVFTHLKRDVQRAWLEEMHRLLAPGGMFVATTRGQLALEFGLASRWATFPSDGIVDAHLDPTLDSVAPEDYYRTTYQSRDYTCREFGKLFEIVEYVERGANNLQDVVVMRKR